jgi:hypothetical protein
MIRLYYYLYRRWVGYPCRHEIMEVLLDGPRLSKAVAQAAHDYAMGYTIMEVANLNRITRERARQYLYKAVRS